MSMVAWVEVDPAPGAKRTWVLMLRGEPCEEYLFDMDDLVVLGGDD